MITIVIYFYLYRRTSDLKTSHSQGSDTRSNETNIGSDVFQVVDIPGKGKGLIAKRDIEVSYIL